MVQKNQIKQRQRAPSKRALETRRKVFDAAELVFSVQGFDGASVRDIAAKAEVPVALVQHHGGRKEALFAGVIARRSDVLSEARLSALRAVEEEGEERDEERDTVALRDVLAAFVMPFFDLLSDPGWRAYGRLIAIVSSDPRWADLARSCFDPTVEVFLTRISALLPEQSRDRIAAHFVYMVSAMLALGTSHWRISALSENDDLAQDVEALLDFCAAGFRSGN